MIDEIEISGTSLSVHVLYFRHDNPHRLAIPMTTVENQFVITDTNPGFHDLDVEPGKLRGYFSMVVPFDVEHLVEGIVTKSLFKRIESCQFILTPRVAFAWGKLSAIKIMARMLSGISGFAVGSRQFDTAEIHRIQERLSVVAAVSVTNPKTQEIRKARLSGKIEDYSHVAASGHGLESVQGNIETPIGPVKLTVSKKGAIRFGVKRGFILPLDVLQWVLALIREEKVEMSAFRGPGWSGTGVDQRREAEVEKPGKKKGMMGVNHEKKTVFF